MPELGRNITGDLDLSESREWLCTNGISSLGEIFDAEPPYVPRGSPFQACAVAKCSAPGRN